MSNTEATVPAAKSKSPGVYKTLDAWRGIAALWVVMFHMALVMVSRYPDLAGSWLYWPSMQGGLGVQMFFVISGYCIVNAAVKSLKRKESCFTFVKARCGRIFPPYWFSSLFAIAIAIMMTWLLRTGRVTSSISGQNDFIHRGFFFYLSNATLTQLIFQTPLLQIQCWTLCYEVAFYGIVAIALLASPLLRGERALLNSLHLLTAAILIALIVHPFRYSYPLDLWPEFGLGILVWDVICTSRSVASIVWAAVIFGLILLFGVLHSFPIGPMTENCRETFWFSAAFAALLMVLYYADAWLSSLKPVIWLGLLGAFSYSLYLTHTFSIGLIHQIALRCHLPESLHLLTFSVVIIGAIIFARLFYAFFEKPFMNHRRSGVPAQLPKDIEMSVAP